MGFSLCIGTCKGNYCISYPHSSLTPPPTLPRHHSLPALAQCALRPAAGQLFAPLLEPSPVLGHQGPPANHPPYEPAEVGHVVQHGPAARDADHLQDGDGADHHLGLEGQEGQEDDVEARVGVDVGVGAHDGADGAAGAETQHGEAPTMDVPGQTSEGANDGAAEIEADKGAGADLLAERGAERVQHAHVDA